VGTQHSTWRQLFHQRFWFGPRVRALVRHGNYSQQKADVLCAFLEVCSSLSPPPACHIMHGVCRALRV
jgi:hypothetical protein